VIKKNGQVVEMSQGCGVCPPSLAITEPGTDANSEESQPPRGLEELAHVLLSKSDFQTIETDNDLLEYIETYLSSSYI